MYLASRWLFRNLSRLELVAAWIVILVLIGAFTRYMFVVFARAEQTMVERTVTNINTALKYRVGMARMRGDAESIEELLSGNPVEQLRAFDFHRLPEDGLPGAEQNGQVRLPVFSLPSNYSGEINGRDLDTLRKGQWYYNRREATLVYLIRNDEYFVTDLQGPSRLRYRLEVDYRDENGNGRFDPGVEPVYGLRLAGLDDYEWIH